MYTQGPTVAIYRRGVCRSWPYVISPSLTAMTWIIKFTSDPPTFDRPFFFCISQHTEEEGENKKWNKLIVGIDWGGRQVRGAMWLWISEIWASHCRHWIPSVSARLICFISLKDKRWDALDAKGIRARMLLCSVPSPENLLISQLVI